LQAFEEAAKPGRLKVLIDMGLKRVKPSTTTDLLGYK